MKGAMPVSELERALSLHAARHGIPGAAMVVVHGDELAVAVTGVRDVRTGAPVTPDTRFEGGSLAKTMGASLASRLTAGGVVDLEASIAAQVRELREARWAADATLDDLLSGTSGIPLRVATEFEATFDGDDAIRQLVMAVGDGPSTGRGWSYSNAAWAVLARAIEEASGERWTDAMHRHLLDPAGLSSTSFGASDSADVATGHAVSGEGAVGVEPNRRAAYAPAGLTLLTTAADLARFARILSDDERLLALREIRYDRRVYAWFDAWCRGMARFDWEGSTVWGWSGLTNGQRAELRIVPEVRGALALLTNGTTGRAMFRSLSEELVPRLFGVQPTPLRLRPSGDVAVDLGAYEGVYAWPDREYEVRSDAGGLVLVSAHGVRPIQPLDERVFVVDAASPDVPTITFDRFDELGRPGVMYAMLWGFPRQDSAVGEGS